MKNLFISILLIINAMASHASSGRDYMQMGLNAYREMNFEYAHKNFTQAVKKGVREGSVALAYLALHDLPGYPRDMSLAWKHMAAAASDTDFKSVIYTSLFFQQTRTPEAAYMVGMAYYLHPHRDQLNIGQSPAWEFWYKKSVEQGYAGLAYQSLNAIAGGVSWVQH